MTKLEEVARAICVADGVDPDGFGPLDLGSADVGIYWKFYVGQARAAIEALRGDKRKKETELPDHIWRAGVAAREAEGDQGSVVNIWEAMLDAVLSEEG